MNQDNFDLSGKAVVITGATSGIGLAAATQFAQNGAFVIGIERSEARILQAKNVIQQSKPTGQIVYLLADLANQSEVRHLGEVIPSVLAKHHFTHLHILINNAGVYLEKKQKTIDKIEMTFAVNHLAGFILTHVLLPHLQQAKEGRVITVSSYAHRTAPLNLKRIANPFPYIGLLAYKRSKLCNILFTNELNNRVSDVIGFAVDPGLVNTAIASKGDPGISDWVWQRRRKRGTSTDVPVKTLLYLAGKDDIDTTQGFYYKNCQAEKPSWNARRKCLAEKLLTLSCQLTGIDWQ